LVAAGPSPGTMQSLLMATAHVGSAAAPLGLHDEELLSATAMLAKSTGSPDEGATQLHEFVKTMADKPEARGRSIADFVKDVGQMEASGAMTPELLQQFFGGRGKALQAYSALKNQLPEFEALTKDVAAAPGQDVVVQKINYLRGDGEVAARLAKQAAEGSGEVSRHKEAIAKTELEAKEAVMDTALEKTPWYLGGRVTGALIGYGGKLGNIVNSTIAGYEVANRAMGLTSVVDRQRTPNEVLSESAQGGDFGDDYAPRGYVLPQMPEDEDAELVRVRGELGVARARLAKDRAGLIEEFTRDDGRVSPLEQKRMDRMLESIENLIKVLQAKEEKLLSERALSRGSALPPGKGGA
jgi:hypothetical protein